jgi:hypothetical protein
MSSTRARLLLSFVILSIAALVSAQDSATGSIRGTAFDPSGGRITHASAVVVNTATGVRHTATTGAEGTFSLELLPPGDYSARVEAQGLSPQVTPQLHIDVGGVAELEFHLKLASTEENVTVSASPTLVETQPSAVSALLDERAVNDFPLNGRRFSDLALFSPGVTQDPPIAQLGAINEFQSSASSYYTGATVSVNRRVARGTYLRLSYTYARAIDDGQDALVAGQPATVENSYNPFAERGPSVTDQRHRLVAAFSAEPRLFHRGHKMLGHFFNDWRLSTVVNYGSGRPVNATVQGDPNSDGNDLNDRLPGYSRNAFTGPDYATTDLRLTPTFRFRERYKLNLIAESFNLLNRDNQRVAITSNGMIASASAFVQNSVMADIAPYPGYYQLPNNFMKPNAAYAPRQVQLGLKFIY